MNIILPDIFSFAIVISPTIQNAQCLHGESQHGAYKITYTYDYVLYVPMW